MADLPLSTSDPSAEVKIRMGEGNAGITPKTVMNAFDEIVEKFGDKPALHQKVLAKGAKAEDTPWTTWTWRQYEQQVYGFAKSLISIGFEPFDCINIIGFNSPEWVFANFGAIAAGGIPAGIYATNMPEACKYISDHSKAKVVVCEGTKQLEKFIEIAGDLPELKALVMYGPEDLPADIEETCPSVPAYKFDAFIALGKDVAEADLKARIEPQKPNNVCTLIYTSGTTGPPKAVMVTHDNITWTAKTMVGTAVRPMNQSDCMISYLPLSHIAAQMLDMFAPMATGMQIYFAQPDALKGSIGVTLKDVRPTWFFGVPRVWEKIYDKMQEVAKTVTGVKKMLSGWAKGKCTAHWEAVEFGSKKRSPMMYFLAKKLIHKVHVALGLDRVVSCYVSAAPIEVKILKYFASIDLPILELFGQSECTGPYTVNTMKAWKIGTVGRPMPGTEAKIVEENGELCYRGRHIFAGYMHMDDKTTETIDEEGWLHSGDVVKFDNHDDPNIAKPSGFMTITGRIKELIITAGGENIPPVLIEDQFKLAMPALSNCMAIGDKRKFLSIILTLQVEVDDENAPTDKLTGHALDTSKEIGSTATTATEAQTCDKWKAYFDKGMETANSKTTSRAQKVQKWTLIPGDFSEKGGELTPTLKLKRSVTADKYHDIIEAMYS